MKIKYALVGFAASCSYRCPEGKKDNAARADRRPRHGLRIKRELVEAVNKNNIDGILVHLDKDVVVN